MSNIYHITCPHQRIEGTIQLDGSKSISNRVLIIEALTGQKFDISGLSTSDDTDTLRRMLTPGQKIVDAGHAGTSFRFSTAFFAVNEKEIVITGSERMKQRPIGPLVEAFNSLGAKIEFLEKDGYPPLRICPTLLSEWKDEVTIPANVSSQYISALLMIAPKLPQGLKIHLDGHLVSRPYIEMTIKIMSYFGARVHWHENTIEVSYQPYVPKPFQVEADWSAASYYFTIAAFSESAEINLNGLHERSLQGDQRIKEIMEPIGVKSRFSNDQLQIFKIGKLNRSGAQIDFTECPDIAQTMAVISAGCQIPMQFSGLQTLSIKETDRIKALQIELHKLNCTFAPLVEDAHLLYPLRRYQTGGQPKWKNTPIFETYKDHRMAMSFAPLGLLHPVRIAQPSVVEKSYPGYWNDLKKLGFVVQEE